MPINLIFKGAKVFSVSGWTFINGIYYVHTETYWLFHTRDRLSVLIWKLKGCEWYSVWLYSSMGENNRNVVAEGRQWKLRRSEIIELWRTRKRRLSGLVVTRTIFPSLLLICTNCTSKIRNGTWKISVEGNKNCIITLRLSDFQTASSLFLQI